KSSSRCKVIGGGADAVPSSARATAPRSSGTKTNREHDRCRPWRRSMSCLSCPVVEAATSLLPLSTFPTLWLQQTTAKPRRGDLHAPPPALGRSFSRIITYSLQYFTPLRLTLASPAPKGNGLTDLASLDADFDRVPGLTRYAPA